MSVTTGIVAPPAALDYRNGPRWYQWDPAKWLIAAGAWVGLTRGLRRVPATEMQRARVAMEAKRLTACLAQALPLDALQAKTALEMAHARLDAALTAFQACLDAWRLKKAGWQQKGQAKAEAWRVARAEWKAQRGHYRRDLHAAWITWRRARLVARRLAAA